MVVKILAKTKVLRFLFNKNGYITLHLCRHFVPKEHKLKKVQTSNTRLIRSLQITPLLDYYEEYRNY